MKVQITDSNLINKTIESIIYSDMAMIISFNDNTFVAFECVKGYHCKDGLSIGQSYMSIDNILGSFSRNKLIACGILTKSEMLEYETKEEDMYKKADEERERKLLRTLQAKYPE